MDPEVTIATVSQDPTPANDEDRTSAPYSRSLIGFLCLSQPAKGLPAMQGLCTAGSGCSRYNGDACRGAGTVPRGR